MLNTTLLPVLEPPLPPETPQLAAERVRMSSAADQAQQAAGRIIRESEQRIASWKSRIDELKVTTVATAPSRMLTEDECVDFDRLIADFEAEAESRAILLARREKRSRKEIARRFTSDTSLGSVTRAFDLRLAEIEREVIADILEYALFLRAFRSERIPQSRGGPVFDEPQELARYLHTTSREAVDLDRAELRGRGA